MSIIPIIFFALVFGLGSVFSSSGDTSVQQAQPAPSAAASPVAPSSAQMPAKLVKQMFTYREPLPSCDSWQCLQDAADAGDGGELVRTTTTDEGDPITTYHRVSYGQLEVFTDNSQDSLRGGPAWTYQACLIPDDVRQGCAGS